MPMTRERRRVRFILDLRTHPSNRMPDERMAPLLGPVLRVESDQTFSDRDLENIQRIGLQGKADDTGKTGRFGLGFNTVYSVTDYPSFATRDRIVTFDPFFDAVALEGEPSGCDWPLDALWKDAPDWPRAFCLSENECNLGQFTAFRLPLRTPSQVGPDRIARQHYPPEEMEKTLHAVEEQGDSLLLFLRSVLAIEVQVIRSDGSLSWETCVRTSNPDEVTRSRHAVVPAQGVLAKDLLASLENLGRERPVEFYLHSFEIKAKGDRRLASWAVCQGMFIDEEGDVLKAAKNAADLGERAVPLAGAALRVREEAGGEITPLPIEGQLCCALPVHPLPFGFMVNARWSLYSSRNQVHFSQDVQGPDAARVAWNRMLAAWVVPAAVATLFERISQRMGKSRVEAYYECWPDLTRLSEDPAKTMGESIYDEFASRNVIRVAKNSETVWVKPEEARLAPSVWNSDLISCVVTDGLALARPAPPVKVVEGMKAVKQGIPNLTPSDVREFLKKHGTQAPNLTQSVLTCLRSPERLMAMLGFCSESGRAGLDGLPLALMQDGALRTFGVAETCMGDASARSLFRERPEWFLDERIETKGLVQKTQASRLVEMTPANAISRLGEFLVDEDGDPWTPTDEAAPGESWLVELFAWLSNLPDLPKYMEPLKRYVMIPGDDGCLYRPGYRSTPLLPDGQLTQERQIALAAFGVRVVQGSPRLLDVLALLRKKANGELVWFATSDDVIDSLDGTEWPDLPPQSSHRRVLLDWLAAGHTLRGLTDERLKELSMKALWPTQDDRVVSSQGRDIYIPEGFEPPAGFSRKTLLQTGENGQWRTLLQALGVRGLDRSTWILECFIPQYGGLDPQVRSQALIWFRDEGVKALDGDGEMPKKVREAAQKIPLIIDGSGSLRTPSTLYHPNAKKALDLLGDAASVPDMTGTYRKDSECWEYFFDRLGLHKYPRREDIVSRVEALVDHHTPERENATVEALLAVFDHLGERLERSGEEERNFLSQKLRTLAWIPTMRRASEDVALFLVPTTPLVLPAEAHPPGLIHTGASQVAFSAVGTEKGLVRSLLGMPEDVSAEKALAHFLAVRLAWVEGPEKPSAQAVTKASEALYRRTGLLDRRARQSTTQARQAPRVAISASQELKRIQDALRGLDCIWEEKTGRLWRADRVFAEDVGGLAGLRTQVVSQESLVSEGFDSLGRKPRVLPEDYVSVLRELATTHCDQVLPQDHLRVALHCWQRLREENLCVTPDLPVLTREGRLVMVSRSLVDDAEYWSRRLSDISLPWLHPQIDRVAALCAGAHHLSTAAHEGLVSVAEKASEDVRNYCEDREKHIASETFVVGLGRILAHAADPDDDLPDVDRLRALLHLKLEPCSELRAGLTCQHFGVLVPVGEELVPCLLDEAARPPCLWVADADPETFACQLTWALVRRLQASDFDTAAEGFTGHLEAILRCKTSQVQARLDSRHVRTPLRSEEPPEEESPEDVQAESGLPNSTDASSEPPEEDSTGQKPAPGKVRQAGSDAENGSHEPTPAGTPSQDPRRHPGGARNVLPLDAPPRRTPLTGRVEGNPASGQGENNTPPTTPGWGGRRSKAGCKSQFYSYLAREGETSEEDAELSPGRLATARAAVDHVVDAERRPGWIVRRMPEDNEGYDLEIQVPGEPGLRYVEVKGLGEAWDVRGVRLTPAELRAAHREGDRYWLYVVEYAKDPRHRRLYRICNPAGHATAYCLDQGWAVLDEPEVVILPPAPGRILFDGDSRIGEILEVKELGEARRIVVDQGEGRRRTLTWNPATHRIMEK